VQDFENACIGEAFGIDCAVEVMDMENAPETTISGASEAPASPARKRVTFRFHADPRSEVFVAGTFNNWKPRDMRLKDRSGTGSFNRTVLLPKGRYEYKFVVNGSWCVDPNCADWVPNSFGALNSVLKVE
jgi:1,4-alpha-glucan branching enzyme